jgi:hypothetical protein
MRKRKRNRGREGRRQIPTKPTGENRSRQTLKQTAECAIIGSDVIAVLQLQTSKAQGVLRGSDRGRASITVRASVGLFGPFGRANKNAGKAAEGFSGAASKSQEGPDARAKLAHKHRHNRGLALPGGRLATAGPYLSPLVSPFVSFVV